MVGTHALLTEEVGFRSLGCVVIDEQHRFGVEQRATLRAKGADGDPDLLVMTATPIPRTAAMVIFGDLDLTTLDELPPGRVAVTTEWLPGEGHIGEARAWDRVRSEVAAGHRAFVVCPLVGESLRVEAKSATEEYERLAAGELAGLRVGLLHGQMAAGDARGGDGPLPGRRARGAGGHDGHRGRRGRARGHGHGDRERRPLRHRPAAPAARPRRPRLGRPAGATCSGARRATSGSTAVARSTDGFALAEADLRVRGEGTLLGARQKGQSDLRLASLSDPGTSRCWSRRAGSPRPSSPSDPRLDAHPDLADEVRLLLSEDEGAYLFKS